MAEQQEATTQADTPNKSGRPTKLNQELIDLAAKYLKKHDNFGAKSMLPTVERLSIILNVNRDTLYAWDALPEEEKTPLHVAFSDIFMRLKAVQADKLLQMGLTGRYNPVITKLMLTKHDYTDKTQTDLTTNGKELSLPMPILGGASQADA
jgi:hypothetical protein